MAGVQYILGAVLVLGLVQGDVVSKHETAIIEYIRDGSSARIVGGWPAQEGQIPFQSSIRMVLMNGQVSSCGGSLIHHQWVLTAAHCLANCVSFVVRLGLTNLTMPEVIVETMHKHIHPDYIEFIGGVQTADIALLELDHFIPYGPNIQPCRLQNSELRNTNYEGVRFTVSGYGRTDDTWNGGTASEILLWTHLLGVTNEECVAWYSGSSIIAEQTVCAGSYNESSQSSCQGDSGGPLTIEDLDGNPTLIGVVSFGNVAGCNGPHPSGFVRPGHYQDWFTEITGINFDWPTSDLSPINLGLDLPNQRNVIV